MDLLYSVHRKAPLPAALSFESKLYKQSIISVSTSNIVAYTTTNEIGCSDPNQSWGFHVYVADINTPWFAYKVLSSRHAITVIEWDVLGRQLLVCDIAGTCTVWQQRDNLLSDWQQVYTCRFVGEHIVRAAFFHNGRRVALVTDKKDVTNYMEKFQRVKCAPSVRQFGGVAADGVLIVSATGLVGAFSLPSESPANNSTIIGSTTSNNQSVPPAGPATGSSGAPNTVPGSPIVLTPATQSLGSCRSFCDVVDISYGKDGHFRVAVINGNSSNIAAERVKCYRVLVKKRNDQLTVTSVPMPRFFLSDGISCDMHDVQVTHLKWMDDSLLVGMRHPGGCIMETWSLVEKSTLVHRTLAGAVPPQQQQQQAKNTESYKTEVWAEQVHFKYSSPIVDICTSKFQYGNSSYIFVSLLDNTVQCLHRDTLNRGLPNVSLACGTRAPVAGNNSSGIGNSNNTGDIEPSLKVRRIETQISAHDISHMGHLLVAVDSHGQLYVYRVAYPHQDTTGGQMTVSYIVSLLEYCLVAGYDAIDVHLLVRPQLLDGIVDRLTENFTRQPPPVQQYYYVNFLTMKTNLYRLAMGGLARANDLTSLLMLHSILIAFKSLLRPSDLTSHDKGPAENLAMVLSESLTDIDKVVLGLKAKDFTVEKSTLQSLQQLMQWVADLALKILAKLPENRSVLGAQRNSGYEISKDIVALNSIREILVMMRFWGLLKPQSLPVFARSDENLDVLLQCFKLLTRLALNPNEPDDFLLDECCLLSSQVLIPQLQLVSGQTSITSPVLPFASLPIYLEYNVEPARLKFWPDGAMIEGGLPSDSMVDSVRHLHLGKRPSAVRRCTRCGVCSSVSSVARTAAMRAWEQRWSSGCRCGGSWRLQTLD